MYVRKFEGDTLEETLQAVKFELGPDAIILKTITNKGIKAAFKKKKFEITAAISEQSYVKKAKVDRVLNEDQKRTFYNSSADHVATMINQYNGEGVSQSYKAQNSGEREMSQTPNYGNLGLNKVVHSLNQSATAIKTATQKLPSKIRSSLDEFLTEDDMTAEHDSYDTQSYSSQDESDFDQFVKSHQATTPTEPKITRKTTPVQTNVNSASAQDVSELQSKILELEKKLNEVAENRPDQTAKNPEKNLGLFQLRTTLKTLDIDESIIRMISKKAQFELTPTDLMDQDVVFEYALRELHNMVMVAMPLYSKTEMQNKSVFTVVISEVASGQTSMVYKLAATTKNAVVITFDSNKKSEELNFTSTMLGLEKKRANSLAELMTFCRQFENSDKKIFIDFKGERNSSDDTKKFIDSLHRSFKNIQVLVNISAIHSELYNRRIVSKYQEVADGVMISHVDLCLNFGALVNVHVASHTKPLMMFGTGQMVPEDIESATSERLLSGMFEF
jgi:flagellar biosynthesis protein FlhF